MSKPVVTVRAEPAYLKAFATIMARIDVALGATRRGGPIAVIVAGGSAVYLYTGARFSKDIDAEIKARFLPPDNLEASYRGKDGHTEVIYFDRQYNSGYALMHEDADDAAYPIEVEGVDPKRLDVRLLSPIDLAVSKLSRFEEHDREDIRALARLGLIDADALRRRAEDALPGYVGDVRRVKTSIDIACRLVEKERKSA